VRAVSDRERAGWEVKNARAGIVFTITKPGWRWITQMPGSSRFLNAKSIGDLILIGVLGGALSLGWMISPLRRLWGWIRNRSNSSGAAPV
jgi:hypothetical protein